MTMSLRTLVVGALQTNCYLLGCERSREAAVIDPGDEAGRILAEAEAQGLRIGWILLTHFHFDHALAALAVQQATGATLAIHVADAPLLHRPPALLRAFGPAAPAELAVGRALQDGDLLTVGDLTLETLHTPGHSPGGASFWLPEEKAVFSGDALFREGLGRTDFPGCSQQTLLQSITRRLLTLPEETAVYPGHGPATTIGHEKRHNPWLRGLAR